MSFLKKRPSEQASLDYLSGLASLLYLRGLNHTDHFILASNLGGVGAFGDHVFMYRENQQVTACFFHMQQSSLGGATTNVSSQLLNYFLSFRKIKSALPWLEEQVGEEIHDLEMICYTDAKHSAEESFSHADHIADCGGLVCGSGSKRKAWELFEEINKFWDFLLRVSYEIEEGANMSGLKESIEIFKSVVGSEEILQRVEILMNDLSESGVEILLSELGGAVDKLDFQFFLQNFKVFHSQPDEPKLMELVEDEFIKLSIATSDSDGYDDEEYFARSLHETFVNFVKCICEWVEDGDNWLSRYSQMWANVVSDVVNLIGQPMMEAMKPYEVQFTEDSLETLSEEILENSVVCVNCNSENTILNLVKIHNVLDGLLYFLLDIGSLIKYRTLVMKAIERFWCSILVIDTTGSDESELGLLLGEICRSLDFNNDARLVLVARNADEVLKPCLDMLEIQYENYDDVVSWFSFNGRCQTEILNKRVFFQTVETSLGVLLGPYSDIFSELQGDFLYSILTAKDVVIGCDLPDVSDYFPRTLSRSVAFNTTLLRSKISNTLIALSGMPLDEIIKSIPDGENYHIYDPNEDTGMKAFEGIQLIAIKDESDEEPFNKIATDGNMSVHYFNLSGDKLTWKWSIGDMSTLDQYLLKEKPDHFHLENASESPEKLTVVTADEDVGKTTFLRHVARGTKLSDASTWVVFINLPDHEDFINSTLFDDPGKLLPRLHDLATYPYDCVLSDILFSRYWKDGNVAVFIDGFENVPLHLTSQIVDMIKLLRGHTKHVFVTCHSKIRNTLCGSLCCFPFSLLPVTLEDQKRYLFTKWGDKVADNERLGAFVDAVLSLINNSVGDEDKKLCCAPLLTSIVANAYDAELLAFAASGNIAIPNKLNLVYFYEKYIEKCCYDYLVNRTDPSLITQQLLIQNKLKLRDRYMVLAVMLMLSKEDLKLVGVISAQYQSNKDLKKLRQTVGEGSLIRLVSDYPVFAHRTLPEYFLAAWLSEVFATAREFLEERFLEPRFAAARRWFDRALGGARELHWAVLNDDEAAAGALLAAGAPVNAPDDAGRTPLHLAAVHDLPHMVGLLLAAGADVALLDNVLGWRPLRYADRVRAWGALDRLLPAAGKAAKADLVATARLLDSEVLLNAALLSVSERGYVHLLEFFHSQGVEVKKVIDFEGSTSLHIAAENGRSEMVKYLLSREMEVESGGNTCSNMLSLPMCLVKRSGPRLKPEVNLQRNDGSSAVILAAQEGHADTLRALFDFDASPNIKKLNGSTALHAAVAENHIEAARALLEAGAEVDRDDGEGTTPLHAAAAEGHAGLVRLLLERGAAANGADNTGATPLHWAAAAGHLRCAEALVHASAFANAKDADLCTPLHWAAMEGQSAVVRFLLSKGADAKVVNSRGGTAVHAAARENRPGTLFTFMKAGVDVNIVNPDGTTPLHWACDRGKDAAVMCLLEMGADLDAANYDGYTALHLAALRGHSSLVKKLLKAGAHADGGSSGRRAPPLHLAAKGEHIACVLALLDAGASVNARDPVGATALHRAAWCGHKATLDTLLRAGADAALADNHGSVALHWAAGEGHARAAAVLLAAGAAPDTTNRDGDAPLHWAAKEGHADTVAALLAGGADPELRNDNGEKPARLAARAPHMDVVQMLEEAVKAKELGIPRGAPPAEAEAVKEAEKDCTVGTDEERGACPEEENSSSSEEEQDNSREEEPKATVVDAGKETAVKQMQVQPVEEEEEEEEEEESEESDECSDEDDEELYAEINPHTSSLFPNSFFSDWGDDDKSKVSLVRLSMGVSDYSYENAEASSEALPGVHQRRDANSGKAGQSKAMRRASRIQFEEKLSRSNKQNEEDDSLNLRAARQSKVHFKEEAEDIQKANGIESSDVMPPTPRARNFSPLEGHDPRTELRESAEVSEEEEEDGDEIFPVASNTEPASPNTGGVFSAFYGAGASLMRLARRAIGSESDVVEPADMEHSSIALATQAAAAQQTGSDNLSPIPSREGRSVAETRAAEQSVREPVPSVRRPVNGVTNALWADDSSDSEEEFVTVSGGSTPVVTRLPPDKKESPDQLPEDGSLQITNSHAGVGTARATDKGRCELRRDDDSDASC